MPLEYYNIEDTADSKSNYGLRFKSKNVDPQSGKLGFGYQALYVECFRFTQHAMRISFSKRLFYGQ